MFGCRWQAYEQVAPVVKSAVDTATPYVEKAAETVAPAIKAAEPTLKAGRGRQTENRRAGGWTNTPVDREIDRWAGW
jgi:hypothetical protein